MILGDDGGNRDGWEMEEEGREGEREEEVMLGGSSLFTCPWGSLARPLGDWQRGGERGTPGRSVVVGEVPELSKQGGG